MGFFHGLYGSVLAQSFSVAETARHVRTVKKLARLRPGMAVLDVPCGMGRLSVPLARLGVRVTGVDIVEHYLEQARTEALCAGVEIELHHGDMREMVWEREFDVVVNWFSSFGYFNDPQMLGFARQLWRVLKPGGSLVLEVVNKSWLLRHFRARSVHVTGGVRIVQSHRWLSETQQLLSAWELSRDGRTERHQVVLRLYNGTEMRALLHRAGFRDIRLYDDRAGVPRFSRHSPRLIAVAARPEG